jgi:hypothetical protein
MPELFEPLFVKPIKGGGQYALLTAQFMARHWDRSTVLLTWLQMWPAVRVVPSTEASRHLWNGRSLPYATSREAHTAASGGGCSNEPMPPR